MTVTLSRSVPVGVVGLGNLGLPMALNLIDRGWTLRVADVTRERLAPALAAGADAALAVDLAECPVICFVVPDDAAIGTILDSGLQDRLTADHILIVHSTTLPDRARDVASSIEAATGARYLDVPVSGGSQRARSGELTAFLGGEPRDIDYALPLLQDEASQRFHLGPVGTASATKLANQLIAFSALGGVHEALRLTAAYEVDEQRALAAIATATGDTWVGRNFAFWDQTAIDYNRAGVALTDRPWSKDLAEVLMTARALGLHLPIASLLSEVLPAIVEHHADAVAAKTGA